MGCKFAESARTLWPDDVSDDDLLRSWIMENGGYVHPNLYLGASPRTKRKQVAFLALLV